MRDVLAGTPAGRGAQPGGGQPAGLHGGLGGILDSLAGPGAPGSAKRAGTVAAGGGLDDLLGTLAAGGGLGGLLGGLAGAVAGGATAGGAAPPGAQPANAGFGDLLNQSLRNFGEPDVPPAPQQEAAAALLLRAMIQAAKADGKVDAAERAKLLDSLADAGEAEVSFVKAERAAPVDIDALARQVPKGLEAQAYAISLAAITLDNQTEAQYLAALAAALGLDQGQVNAIHADLGAPALYS